MIGYGFGVQNQSGVNPNLKLELKFNYQVYTDLAATVAANTNDYVRAWRSSVGNHLFTQSTDAARPQRQSDGLYFDGGDWLSMLMHADFNWGSGNFTVEGWKFQATPSYWFSLTAESAAYAALRIDGNAAYLSSNGSSWGVNGLTIGANINEWSHIAIVGDNGTIRTYRGGIQQGSTVYAAAMYFNTSKPFHLGGGHTWWFTGKMTDIRLYTACIYPNGTTFTPPTRSA